MIHPEPQPSALVIAIPMLMLLIPMGVFTAANYYNVGPYTECQEDEVAVFHIIQEECIDYEENLDKVLKGMNKIELPASSDTIAQVTPGITRREVTALLERYQEETSNVYTEYEDGGIEKYNLVKQGGEE